MNIVTDTSALLTVLIGEPERNRVIELTAGHSLIGPGSIPWEIGNAFSAMLKQRRLTLEAAQGAMTIFNGIPIRYVAVDLKEALTIAQRTNMYAYDAYFLDCAVRHGAPLLTLDKALMRAGRKIGINLIEV